MSRLFFGILLGALGLAALVRYVAGARRSGWATDWETGDALPEPDPHLLALARRAAWN